MFNNIGKILKFILLSFNVKLVLFESA